MITFALIVLMSKAMLQVVQWLGYALLFLVLSGQVRLYKHFGSIEGNALAAFYRCCGLKQMVNTTAYTIELWMHAGGLQRTQEAQALTFSTSDNSYTSFLLTEEILGDNSCT